MSFPFFNPAAKKREQILAIDLGSRTTKAVLLQRKSDGFSLVRYVIQDAPIYDKSLSSALLGEHLKAIVAALEPKVKNVTLAMGPTDSVLRSTELPLMPASELRQMLKYNTKSYLQQDLPDYVFDCYLVPPRQLGKPEAKPAAGTVPKYKVWVGGMKRQLLADLQTATKMAGLIPDQIGLSLLGPVNAFEMAQPEAYAKEVVALIDLGFKTSSIAILSEGELCLSRVVDLGGDKVTAALAEAMGISYAEADGIKIGMPGEVAPTLEPLLTPLGRELRASIDFFEHQYDKPVGQVFISGGASRSEFFVQLLQNELMAPCKPWNPLTGLELALPAQQMAEVEQIATQLTVAIGAASTSF